MPPRQRGRPAATPPCCHCGRSGQTSNICPRDDYSPDLALLTCNQCIRQEVTATGGDTNFELRSLLRYLTMQPTFYADSPASLYCSHRTSNCSGCSSCSQCTAIPNLPLHLSNQLLPLPNLQPSLLHRFDEKYRQVVALVNGGATLNDAKEVVGLKRSTFRRWRLVAGFLNLVNMISRATLQHCETQSKTILQRGSSHNRMEELFRAGVCLRPIRRS